MICTAGAIGAGVAMPLMFLVLGRIVGDLTSYFTPFTKVTKEQFMHGIEKNA
jgi:ATP-binding cassette, subfamily B (MDR/TAP), member 1